MEKLSLPCQEGREEGMPSHLPYIPEFLIPCILAPDSLCSLLKYTWTGDQGGKCHFTQVTNLSKHLRLLSSLHTSQSPRDNSGMQRRDGCSHLLLQSSMKPKEAIAGGSGGGNIQACQSCSALIHGGPVILVPYAVC